MLSTRIVYDRVTHPVYGQGMKPLPLHLALKAARVAAGMTQAQVTEECGWESVSRYPNYEQGTREPSLADLRTIAKAMASGGHTFARIVTGEEVVPMSQVQRPTTDTILAAVRLASGAATGVGLSHFDIETADDAELFALAIEEVLEDGITVPTDSDVQRFARKLQMLRKAEDGQVGKIGSNGGTDRAAGKAKAGNASRSTHGGKQKRATAG